MADRPFSRRRFLAASAALAVAGPAACANAPQPQSSLDVFLQLSSLLTGFPLTDLDRELAQTYLTAISGMLAPGFDMEKLYDETGLRSHNPPRSFEDIQRNALLASEPARAAIEEIMTCWYSGTIPTAGSQKIRVATYDKALAWRSITWTTPNMECRGATGFWSEPPANGVA